MPRGHLREPQKFKRLCEAETFFGRRLWRLRRWECQRMARLLWCGLRLRRARRHVSAGPSRNGRCRRLGRGLAGATGGASGSSKRSPIASGGMPGF